MFSRSKTIQSPTKGPALLQVVLAQPGLEICLCLHPSWCQTRPKRAGAETFCARKPPWHKALWPVDLQHSAGDLPVHGMCVSLHTCLHHVMCSFARWIIFNLWYNCWSDLSVTWQKWLLQSVGLSWLPEPQGFQEIRVSLSSACRSHSGAFISLLQEHFVLPSGGRWRKQFPGQFAH